MNLHLVRRIDGHRRFDPFQTDRDRLGAKQLNGMVRPHLWEAA